jgi:hypothetical protein
MAPRYLRRDGYRPDRVAKQPGLAFSESQSIPCCRPYRHGPVLLEPRPCVRVLCTLGIDVPVVHMAPVTLDIQQGAIPGFLRDDASSAAVVPDIIQTPSLPIGIVGRALVSFPVAERFLWMSIREFSRTATSNLNRTTRSARAGTTRLPPPYC